MTLTLTRKEFYTTEMTSHKKPEGKHSDRGATSVNFVCLRQPQHWVTEVMTEEILAESTATVRTGSSDGEILFHCLRKTKYPGELPQTQANGAETTDS